MSGVLLVVLVCMAFSVWGRKEMPILKDIPTIGIVFKPLENETHEIKTNMTLLLNANYVAYLMGAGAKLVPVSFKQSEAELRSLLKRINGLFFTGGGTDFVVYDPNTKTYNWTPFGLAAKLMMKIARELNDQGVYFPVWGTCMGFQLQAFVASEDPEIPKLRCDCIDYDAELLFTVDAASSRLFSGFSEGEMKELATRPMTYNYHRYYIDNADFIKHKSLRDVYKVLAYSFDKSDSMPFISAMEGRRYPFYGTQFHPEINAYSERNSISGNEKALQAQAFGNFFVNETRKNNQSFTAQEELERSLLNVPIYYDAKAGFIYLLP